MSVSQQDFGFDIDNPVIAGKTFVLNITIDGLTAADVDSIEWILAERDPSDGTVTAHVTATESDGIGLEDGTDSLEVTVTVDGDDTTDLSGDYWHRLDYVHTDGSSYEAARGRGRLTPAISP